MKEYFIFSIINPNYIQHLINLVKSMKYFKRKDVLYNYIIAIDDQNIEQYIEILKPYNSEDFKITIISSTIYQNKINPPDKSYIFYIRCLIPLIFNNLDKILFLDCDLIIAKEGLEQFYDTDITNYYVGACWDPLDYHSLVVQDMFLTKNSGTVGNSEKTQCQTNFYFNAGVMLFNIKKIKEDNIDKELEQYVYKWPSKLQPWLYDQTLLNYVFRNNVLRCSVRYNNMISITDRKITLMFLNEYRKWGYTKVIDSLEDTVILHCAGYPKFWQQLTQDNRRNRPFFDLTKKYFEKIKKLF